MKKTLSVQKLHFIEYLHMYNYMSITYLHLGIKVTEKNNKKWKCNLNHISNYKNIDDDVYVVI